jgi:sortase (surface protein transpeptidase)
MRFRTTGTTGGRGMVAASLFLLVLVLTGCSAADPGPQPTPTPTPTPTQSQTLSPQQKPEEQHEQASNALPASNPQWIDVPAIGVKSSLVALGLNADQTVEVPPVDQPMQAGWYKHGPTPGQTGPAVVLGHVNGGGRDGVFARLHELRPGDEIRIGREDGQVARFVVERMDQVPKNQFPADAVYGNTSEPELRLITCGGSFDEDADSYRDNIIAYAVFTGVVDAEP